ncbi:probable protein phosphatase 2C 43 [Arachis stenosperma]|uniref:probable protein phosphatase 2C 43 n=1 Tax=Arachis stenosperma TaxID=217475 RepID=UPI0025ABD585|nr:probable protein phosphatase 2C 43 [Arachis stenosperma]
MFIRKLCNRVEDIFTERNNPLIWSRELEQYFGGSYCYACVRTQPGPQLEFNHVELGSRVTFIGIYDCHNGPEVASDRHYVRNVGDGKCVLRRKYGSAFVTDKLNNVDNLQDEPARFHFQRQHPEAHAFTADDSGVFLVKGKLRDRLYVRNVGDGKCLLGRKYGSTFVTDKLNDVDNLQDEPARFHFQHQHPEVQAFIADDSGVILVKGY